MASENHEIVTHIPLHIGGVDLSVTTPVLIMWGTGLVVFLFLFLANRFRKVRILESFVFDFVVESFGRVIPSQSRLWFSFLLTLFLFIFFNNLSGLLPGGEAPTSNINVTASLAIMVFVISQVAGIKHHGFHHFQHIVPSGIPKVMIPFFVPLEIISILAKPFSLAVRLFANMYAGHKVLTIFMTLAILAQPLIKILPFAGVVLISMFEIFVAFIQAFIFTYLAAFYISETVNAGH